jgi:undecaprenyl-diphosphatase
VTFIDSIILGIIEGLTEFLPVSSTGHLILASTALGLEHTEFLKTFQISIQLGAIAAILFQFPRSFIDREILKRIAIAFVPTMAVGLVAYDFVRGTLFGNETVVVVTLILGGIIMILFDRWKRPEAEGDVRSISMKQAALIGVFQSCAMVPGVSRSGATVIGGLSLGIPRTAIVEFSFLLAVPTMLAATALDILKTPASLSSEELTFLAIGFLTAFLVAAITVRWFLGFIRTSSFTSFGVYRIVLGAVFFFTFLY